MFVLERLIELVAPFCCLSCGREGGLVCAQCAGRFCIPLPPRCYRCLQPAKSFLVCDRCRRKSLLTQVWIASQLNGLPEQLIHTFKFERAQSAAPQIARLMGHSLPELPRNTLIVPVPTATSRIRERGYDHTALLGKSLARQQGYVYRKALQRHGQARQVGSTRVQRLAQMQGSFRLVRSAPVKGARVLLVDDVVTTGASLEEAARVLRRAGATQIDAIVFAQK